MMKNILVISPHPDDEAIGCGGTISKHVEEGDTVEVVFLTSGEKGGHGRTDEDTIIVRENESFAAADILGISKIDFWREPDGSFEPRENNLIRLANKINVFKPAIIYVTHNLEQHPDHKAAALLVQQTVLQINDTTDKPVVFMYEVWTPIQVIDHIVDISSHIEKKRKAILVYKSQCEVLCFDEAIIGLNRYRGEMHSWPGGDYAEVFCELKYLKEGE